MYFIYLYISIVFAACAVYAINFKILPAALKVIFVYLVTVFVTEVIGVICLVMYKYNLLVYLLLCPVQFALILYSFFRKHKRPFQNVFIGIALCFLFVVLMDSYLPIGKYFTLIKSESIKRVKGLYTYFFIFEGFYIILVSLLAYYRFFSDDSKLRLFRNLDFLIVTIFLFFWSITYLYNGVYDIIYRNNSVLFFRIVYPVYCLVNCFTYLILGVLPILFKKNVIDSD